MSESSRFAHNHLPGPSNLKPRKLYYALKSHHKASECLWCDSYIRYGCSIVTGDLLQHVADVVAFPVAMSDLTKLQEAKLIKLEQVTHNRHRIVFVELAPREVAV
ncbi:MAG TPA: hypothetical protein VHV10_02515 [Ktedonobacteraceae bacterium]|jgi:hypothetical protein|nr:hypothetical protein [Ktedonobacteraceae bacterium]